MNLTAFVYFFKLLMLSFVMYYSYTRLVRNDGNVLGIISLDQDTQENLGDITLGAHVSELSYFICCK